MSVLTIEKPETTTGAEGTEVSAVLRVAGEDVCVKFRVSSGPVYSGVEPFLAVSLFPAARLGLPLETSAECSPMFLSGLQLVLEKFRRLDPTLREIPVHAPVAALPGPKGPRRVGSFFSGGVDSFDTLFRHDEEISDLIFVHGFDIPIENTSFYNRAAAFYEEAAYTVGKKLTRLQTNLRLFTDRFVDWGVFAHGPALGAAALVLSRQVERVLIPGENIPSDDVPPPRGSLPDTDPLYSTEHLKTHHDGHNRTRFTKIGAINHHEIVQRMLRVCWENRDGAYNCCECSKCLRNMAILRAHGALGRFPTFPKPLDLKLLSRLPLRRGEWRAMLEETLAHLNRSTRDDAALEKAIRHCLAGRYYRGPGAFLRRMLKRGRGFCARRIRR